MFFSNKKDKGEQSENPISIEKNKEGPKTEEIKLIKKAEVNYMDTTNMKKVDVKIGEAATIIGTMRGSCIADIEGCFEGTIDLDGDLVLSKTGVVKADVKVKKAVISGTIDGTIYAEESIQLMSTAFVKGDITSKTLVIERGARFIGSSNFIDDSSGVKIKQSISPAQSNKIDLPKLNDSLKVSAIASKA